MVYIRTIDEEVFTFDNDNTAKQWLVRNISENYSLDELVNIFEDVYSLGDAYHITAEQLEEEMNNETMEQDMVFN